jgi:hypothetical protein
MNILNSVKIPILIRRFLPVVFTVSEGAPKSARVVILTVAAETAAVLRAVIRREIFIKMSYESVKFVEGAHFVV